MVDLTSAPVLGFLGGIFGGTVAQGWAFLRRRKRDLDRLRSVLKETREISESKLDSADEGHAEMTDEDLVMLQNELKQTRLQASYLLDEDQRKKIGKVETQFTKISHSTGNGGTSLNNSQLAERFTEKSDEALRSLRWKAVKIWQ